MTLYHGSMHELPNNKPGQMSRMFYQRNRLRVKNVLNSYQESQNQNVSKGDREMSVCEMQRMLSRADLNMRMAQFDSLQTLHEQLGAPTPAVSAARLGRPVRGSAPSRRPASYCGSGLRACRAHRSRPRFRLPSAR